MFQLSINKNSGLNENQLNDLIEKFKSFDHPDSIPNYFQIIFLSYDRIGEVYDRKWSDMNKVNEIDILNLKGKVVSQELLLIT